MTLDEAIKELREASDSEVRYGDKEHHYNEVMRRVEAFDMAIEALEQQPCVMYTKDLSDDEIKKFVEEMKKVRVQVVLKEPCEDCISRAALLARIDEERKHLLDLKMDGAEHIIVHHARRIIEDMPPVTPQRDNSVLERVGDCISRKAAIEHREILKDKQGTGYQAVKTKYIRELPSVTPQPKVGEWLEKEVHSDKVIEEWQSARCSVCDKYHTTPYMYYFSHYDWCPHCGAKMERRQEVDKRRSKRNR